jgi:hypothetical protein
MLLPTPKSFYRAPTFSAKGTSEGLGQGLRGPGRELGRVAGRDLTEADLHGRQDLLVPLHHAHVEQEARVADHPHVRPGDEVLRQEVLQVDLLLILLDDGDRRVSTRDDTPALEDHGDLAIRPLLHEPRERGEIDLLRLGVPDRPDPGHDLHGGLGKLLGSLDHRLVLDDLVDDPVDALLVIVDRVHEVQEELPLGLRRDVRQLGVVEGQGRECTHQEVRHPREVLLVVLRARAVQHRRILIDLSPVQPDRLAAAEQPVEIVVGHDDGVGREKLARLDQGRTARVIDAVADHGTLTEKITDLVCRVMNLMIPLSLGIRTVVVIANEHLDATRPELSDRREQHRSRGRVDEDNPPRLFAAHEAEHFVHVAGVEELAEDAPDETNGEVEHSQHLRRLYTGSEIDLKRPPDLVSSGSVAV